MASEESNKQSTQDELEQDNVQNNSEQEETVVDEKKEKTPEEKYNELNDKYLRLYSEFDNFRRRTAKERIDLFKNASADILSELLPVLDDFDRAVAAMNNSTDIKTLSEGVKLVHNKFNSILTSKGLKEFDAVGKEFDPDFHEAVTKIPAPSKKLRGKVVDVIEKGYMLNDKVLRYAKVVVGE